MSGIKKEENRIVLTLGNSSIGMLLFKGVILLSIGCFLNVMLARYEFQNRDAFDTLISPNNALLLSAAVLYSVPLFHQWCESLANYA